MKCPQHPNLKSGESFLSNVASTQLTTATQHLSYGTWRTDTAYDINGEEIPGMVAIIKLGSRRSEMDIARQQAAAINWNDVVDLNEG